MFEATEQPSLDEQDLLRRAHDLDESALSAIFDAYYEPIYYYIYRHIRHAQAAEDLAAEVFRRFLEALNAQRGPQKFLKAWLYQLAHDLIGKEAQRNAPGTFEAFDDNYEDGRQAVSQLAENAIRNRVVMRALRRLTDKQQEVLYLRFFQGLHLEEVAYALDMTVGTVKSLQYRGLQTLKRYLSQSDEFS